MSRLDKVKKSVEELYLSGSPKADLWISWGYPNHVLFVAKNAGELALSKGANAEFCVAGALLHDIADAVMDRSEQGHEQRCIVMAEEILKKSGFDEKEIETIT